MISPETDRLIRKGIALGLQRWNNSLKASGFIRKHFFCEALFSGRHTAILSDGTVVCSCFSIKKEVVLGSLKRRSLEDIWTGETAERLRMRFRSGEMPSRLCAVCRYFVLRDSKGCYDEVADFPQEAHIESFAGCTLRCLSCDREGIMRSRDETTLDAKLFQGIINELYSKSAFKRLNLIGGGEPFLVHNFCDLIRYAKERNNTIPVHTSTNGQSLDSDDKRDRLIESGLDSIEFTISGSSQGSYERYHRGGNFDKALWNLRRLLEQRRKSTSPDKPFVIWKYLLFTWNDSDEDIHRAKELGKDMGVDRLAFVLTRSPLSGCSRKYSALRKKHYKGTELWDSMS